MDTASRGSIVVVGTGSIGQRHLCALRSVLAEEPIALPIRAGRGAAPELAGVRVVGSLSEAVASGATGAIIATDTARHIADAEAAIVAGCHVLVEKPLSPGVQGLDSLMAVASREGRQVYVACCMRFHATVQRFRSNLPMIGRVYDVRIECQSYLPSWRPARDYRASYSARLADGGALRDLIHEVDYALWMFGVPQHVYARLGNTGTLGIEAEESASLLWEVPRGPVVSLQLDYLTRPPRRMLRACGEQGVLSADLLAQRVTFVETSGEETAWVAAQDRDDMMRSQAGAFLSAIGGGDAGATATLQEGVTAVAICDAARASSSSQRAEAVASW